MKKALLIIAWLLLSLILPACAPMMTYDEIEAEAKLTGDTRRLDAYERERERAEAHFINKAACDEENLVWYCPHGATAKERRQMPSAQEILRDYRKEKWSRCGCITKAQLREVMRELQRQLSRQ